MTIFRKMMFKKNRRLMYLMGVSFLTSVIGYMIVQVLGAAITSFSIWTLEQSHKIPPEFPFFYIPELMIYLSGIMIGSTFFVMLLFRLRMIR